MNYAHFIYYYTKKFEKSEELYREVLYFRRENLMPNDPDIGTSMDYLA